MNLIINSNTCVGAEIYKHLQLEYISPLIGTLIPNDLEFITFVNNFKSNINGNITYDKNPKPNTIFEQQNISKFYTHKQVKIPYPIIHIRESDIHCIHEKTCKSAYNNFIRRVERTKTVINNNNYKIINVMVFTEFINIHDNYKDIIINFLSNTYDDTIHIFMGPENYNIITDNIKNVYIPINKWNNISLQQRDTSHIIETNNQTFSSEVISNYIQTHIIQN
jgi:uncharacterized protein (DUF1919 family)